jgi:glycosyltransferase involved in cell wall biosynthesis
VSRQVSWRALRNGPSAATVLLRHLAKGTVYVDALPQPWRTPAYQAALAALERGALVEAERLAAAVPAGPAGPARVADPAGPAVLAVLAGPARAILRRLIAGEIALLTPSPFVADPSLVVHPSLVADPSLVAHRRPRPSADPSLVAGSGASVLHLVTNSLPETVAGYTIRTQGIARAQQARGIDVHVATRIGFPVTKGHLDAEDRVTVDGIEHHRLLPARLPLRADDALRRDIELTARLVESLRPDVLHAHSNHVNAQVALALRARFGIPVVYELRGFLEETWRSRSTDPHAGSADAYRLARAAETQCLRAADAVVTISEPMRDAIIERGVPPERVSVVPNGVDLAMTEEAAPQEAAFAGNPTEWVGLLPAKAASGEAATANTGGSVPTSTGTTVGTVGTLNPYEGIDLLIDAVATLRHQGHDLHLRIVGDGPDRVALEKRAADSGIGDATTFTGRVPHDQVAAQHRLIDIFCVPRRDLPVTRLVPPLKPVEAMALGRAVVASDLPPLRELLGPDGDGFQRRGLLVPAGDTEALADALLHLIDAPDVRRQLGANAHAWVARTRTWDAAAHSYDQIYHRIQGDNT